MKKVSIAVLLCLAAAIMFAAGCGSEKPATTSQIGDLQAQAPHNANANEPMRMIVVFEENFRDLPAQEALIRKFGEPLKSLPIINGWAVLLPPKAIPPFAAIPEVLRIDPDAIVYALAKPTPTQPPQTIPWGITRIGAPTAWNTTKGTGIKVAILDTGIDLTHPDLKDNIKGGVNTINPTKSYTDDNGHGTHVAGVVAALNNTIGVVGVGPEIWLYSVKVLNRTGTGFLSDVIEGLQWCIDNGMQVVNMSFGTSSDVQSFHDAVTAVYNAGITQVAAAGNGGPGDSTVTYPAKYSEVIAVTASDSSDAIASWSSRGPEVDLIAPGVNIYSTYKGSTYKTLSGTSMAASHVTGTAALVIATGIATSPDGVKARLQATAEDLGLAPNEQGAGLVRVDLAVAQ